MPGNGVRVVVETAEAQLEGNFREDDAE